MQLQGRSESGSQDMDIAETLMHGKTKEEIQWTLTIEIWDGLLCILRWYHVQSKKGWHADWAWLPCMMRWLPCRLRDIAACVRACVRLSDLPWLKWCAVQWKEILQENQKSEAAYISHSTTHFQSRLSKHGMFKSIWREEKEVKKRNEQQQQ